MENVPGMLSMNGANIADEAAAELESHGYRTGYAVLNAVWYGVPQYRERLVLIAFRQDLGLTPLMPPMRYRAELPTGYFYSRVAQNEAIGRQLSLFNGHESYQIRVETVPNLRPAVTVGEALADLPALTAHLEHYSPGHQCDKHYKDEQIPGYSTLMRCWPGFRPVRKVSDHIFRKTARDYETFRRMKPGDRYPEALAIARQRFEEELERRKALGLAPLLGTVEYDELKARFVPPYPEDIFVDKWRKLAPDKPSPTLPAHLSKDSYSHLHYDDSQGRSISVREAARLQTFPDAFQFTGNMGDCFRQIGNAVPPLMAWAIAHQLLTQLGVPAKPSLPELELE
jgi:DNA (cytosine-5)-methyltransferase 1